MAQKADFKLIIFVNSDVTPVTGSGSAATSDPCGPGQAYQSHNLFAPESVYKAAGYQWAVYPYNTSQPTWQPWGASDLAIHTDAWDPNNLYFEVWDTNPNLSTSNLNQVTCTNLGFATSDDKVFAPGTFVTPPATSPVVNYPPNDPTLYSTSLTPTPATAILGNLSLSCGPSGAGVSFPSCAVWISSSIAFASDLSNPLKVKVVAFIQISCQPPTPGNSVTVLYFTCDPDMILDTI